MRNKCQPPYRMLARQLCPRMCATCCFTKEYNCENASPTQNCKDERQGCEAIRALNSCGGVFRTTMMQQCA
ncbi:unnamed protein product [Dracunculus medinensis]|uniref:ShKT domain-containing protein n=1 Tax=Dracunculus medinensis TaxID=318479 RepID=A0A0N4URQ4_DRAME|nr:unnamed protein product [Dracunculus medinensis]